eukprot:53076-Chlamydomonas_euryale.AAC.1
MQCFCYKNWFMMEQCRIPGDTVTQFPIECHFDQVSRRGAQVEPGWNAGGTQVELRWDAGGTQVERRWNAGETPPGPRRNAWKHSVRVGGARRVPPCP